MKYARAQGLDLAIADARAIDPNAYAVRAS
jgi:hypothetical protein